MTLRNIWIDGSHIVRSSTEALFPDIAPNVIAHPIDPNGGVTQALVDGTSANDFIHIAGDGNTPPVGYNDITGVTAGDDEIRGGDGDDIIYGGAGLDFIDGGTGADTMYGGANKDTFVVDNAGDQVIETAGSTIDTVLASVSFVLPLNVENLTLVGVLAIDGTGNTDDNRIIGNDAGNEIDGGAGADDLDGRGGDDTIFGGEGNDILRGGAGADIISGDDGTDLLSYGASPNAVTVDLLAAVQAGGDATGDQIGGVEDLTGSAFADSLSGDNANNYIRGGNGGDTMAGRGGDDHYVAENSGDVVIEAADEGYDIVISSVTFALADNIEELYLAGFELTGTGNDLPNLIQAIAGGTTLYGGGGDDHLVGTNEGDVLDGGNGADTMDGGGMGDDLFYVDNIGDVIIPATNGFSDVVSTISYILGDHLRNLTLGGVQDISGTGNGGNNTIVGAQGDNQISGSGGNDSLFGGFGNDTLDGGIGGDTMSGGGGRDTYIVDTASDSIVESSGQGLDSVVASKTFVLPDNVENLTLVGINSIRGTGNTDDNTIAGNAGVNTLRGRSGDDALNGGALNDTLTGGKGADKFRFSSASDTAPSVRDTVTDFHHAQGDLIGLTGIDANVNLGGDQAFTLGGSAFTNTAGELIQFFDGNGNTIVAGDTDGDGNADFEIEVAGAPTLVAADFVF